MHFRKNSEKMNSEMNSESYKAVEGEHNESRNPLNNNTVEDTINKTDTI